jgi:SAM-dependent methyltransferase
MDKIILSENNDQCLICGSIKKVAPIDIQGYREEERYKVYYCSICNTSHVSPQSVDSELYNLIYSNASAIPGYDRYVNYASCVEKKPSPLNYLADSEDVYWGIQTALDSLISNKKTATLKVLEVGSGLGYLTYSLHKEGIDVLGIDISSSAVEAAIRRYGDLYKCCDLIEFSKSHPNEYNLIIFTEVIEHLPNFFVFLNAMDKLLVDDGAIILTTPNKGAYPKNSIWQTDLPPVHLWWFSEVSLRFIARKIGYSIQFIDFSEYNKKHYRKGVLGNLKFEEKLSPIFDRSGKLIRKNKSKLEFLKQILKFIGFVKLARHFQFSLLHMAGGIRDDSAVLCSILMKDKMC